MSTHPLCSVAVFTDDEMLPRRPRAEDFTNPLDNRIGTSP